MDVGTVIGLIGGAAIGSLLWGFILQIATRWIIEEELEFDLAYSIVFLSTLLNFFLGFIVGYTVSLSADLSSVANSHAAADVFQFFQDLFQLGPVEVAVNLLRSLDIVDVVLIGVGFVIKAAFISSRLMINSATACLITLTMEAIVVGSLFLFGGTVFLLLPIMA